MLKRIDWYETYVDRMNDHYYKHIKTRYKPFIDILASLCVAEDQWYIELGCGASNITRALIERKTLRDAFELKKFLVIDSCDKMLDLSRHNLRQHMVHYKLMDVFENLPTADQPVVGIEITYSHGLLEHYGDKEIQLLIQRYKIASKYQVHYVPGEKYGEPSFGDERLLSVDAWNKICKPTEIVTFNNGYDYALIWR